MPFDSRLDDLDEETPEDRWGDPERDLPRIPESPTPDGSGIADTDADVDPDLSRTFWVCVVLANVAVAGVALGSMLWYFRGQLRLGGGLVLVGLFAFVRLSMHYRSFRERRDDTSARDGAPDDDRRDPAPDDSAAPGESPSSTPDD